MIEREVEVVSVDERHVQVEAGRSSACHHCGVSHSCGTSALDKWMNRKNRIRLEKTLDVQCGDKVMLGIDEIDLIRSSFIVYIVPVLMMLMVAAMVAAYTQAQGVIALTGLGALLGSFFIIRNSTKRHCPVMMLHKVTSNRLVAFKALQEERHE